MRGRRRRREKKKCSDTEKKEEERKEKREEKLRKGSEFCLQRSPGGIPPHLPGVGNDVFIKDNESKYHSYYGNAMLMTLMWIMILVICSKTPLLLNNKGCIICQFWSLCLLMLYISIIRLVVGRFVCVIGADKRCADNDGSDGTRRRRDGDTAGEISLIMPARVRVLVQVLLLIPV